MNAMKKLFAACLLLCTAAFSFAQTPAEWAKLEKDVNFYVANDLGRNGYYDQKPIAELMGTMAETVGIECVVAAGDVHHFEGVRSVNDPLWMTNYELIYSHPELMLPWYPILGNHEYRGNTQAVLDYAKVSARWDMEGRYYTKVIEDNDVTVRLVLIDTSPLLDKYRKDTEKYPDAGKQDIDAQLKWLDEVLTSAKEDWVLVIGHHPIYADTDKSEKERTDMQARVNTILLRHPNVAMYICGHIHTFQHIRKPDTDIDYVVNSSASLARDVKPIDGTVYCSGEPGFSLVSADKSSLSLYMMDKEGRVLHTVQKSIHSSFFTLHSSFPPLPFRPTTDSFPSPPTLLSASGYPLPRPQQLSAGPGIPLREMPPWLTFRQPKFRKNRLSPACSYTFSIISEKNLSKRRFFQNYYYICLS